MPSTFPDSRVSIFKGCLLPSIWYDLWVSDSLEHPVTPPPQDAAAEFLGHSKSSVCVYLQDSSFCQMYYFELPFGLCLTYSQWTWLGWNWGERRLLAQRFPQDSWENCWHYLSGKLLLSWTKWWPIFPPYLGYVPPLPLPTPCLHTCIHTGQLSL